jgi:prepilin-type N-terminal cleavage/methylation domain-containing protein
MSLSRSAKRGFTLVEVVAGLTLLASLAVGVLLAARVHQRQIRFARERLAVIDLTDLLIESWQAQPSGIPVFASGPFGPVSADAGWRWQTRPVGRRLVFGLPVDVIRLEVFRTQAPGEAAGGGGPPLRLCSVELLRSVPASELEGLR